MNLVAEAASPVPRVEMEIEVEADLDLGVTSRMLDLLVTHDRLPRWMNLVRDKERMTVRMSLPSADAVAAKLLAKMRQIPGVRRVEALADLR